MMPVHTAKEKAKNRAASKKRLKNRKGKKK